MIRSCIEYVNNLFRRPKYASAYEVGLIQDDIKALKYLLNFDNIRNRKRGFFSDVVSYDYFGSQKHSIEVLGKTIEIEKADDWMLVVTQKCKGKK